MGHTFWDLVQGNWYNEIGGYQYISSCMLCISGNKLKITNCVQLFNHYFIRIADIHSHTAKHYLDIHQIRCKRNIRACCIKIFGAKVCNSIPECITKVTSIHIFKNSVKKFVQQSERLDNWLRHRLHLFLFHFPTNSLTFRGDYGFLTATP